MGDPLGIYPQKKQLEDNKEMSVNLNKELRQMNLYKMLLLIAVGVFWGLAGFSYFNGEIAKAIFWILSAIALIIVVIGTKSDDQ